VELLERGITVGARRGCIGFSLLDVAACDRIRLEQLLVQRCDTG
jgi:hypothetical protein